jgi:hypothetical protein
MSPISETQKRGVLLRGIYSEAVRTHSPDTAYTLFHELKVDVEEVDCLLGPAIGDYYAMYLTDLRAAQAGSTKREGAHAA